MYYTQCLLSKVSELQISLFSSIPHHFSNTICFFITHNHYKCRANLQVQHYGMSWSNALVVDSALSFFHSLGVLASISRIRLTTKQQNIHRERGKICYTDLTFTTFFSYLLGYRVKKNMISCIFPYKKEENSYFCRNLLLKYKFWTYWSMLLLSNQWVNYNIINNGKQKSQQVCD